LSAILLEIARDCFFSAWDNEEISIPTRKTYEEEEFRVTAKFNFLKINYLDF
jgi:hypothetical protein